MSNELTIVRPEGALADLVAKPHIATTMAVLANELLDQNPAAPTINRLPTAQERSRLAERKTEIHVLMRRGDYSIASGERVGKAVGEMIGGWLNVRGNPQEIIAGWTAKLVELPCWAVILACKDFTEFRAELPDASGKMKRIDGAYVPSLAQVYALARSKLDTLYAEAEMIDRLTRAKLAAPIEDPVEQEQVAEQIKNLAASMGAKHDAYRAAAERESKAALAAAKGRAEQFRIDADKRRLERYAELGMKPVYVGDRLCDAYALPAKHRVWIEGDDHVR